MTNTITIKASALSKGDTIPGEHFSSKDYVVADVIPAVGGHVLVSFEGEELPFVYSGNDDVRVALLAPETAATYAPSHGGYPGTVVPA